MSTNGGSGPERISGPQAPNGWRDVLRNYTYPDEELGDLSRRQRRGFRRRWREQDRAARAAWLREQREREPMTGGGALILVLAVTGLVLGSYLLFGVSGPTKGAGPAPSTASVLPAPAVSFSSSPSADASPSPSVSADLSSPQAAATGFTTALLTRDPTVDRDHIASDRRAGPWMTPALLDNLLANEDPLFDHLVGGQSAARVTAVALTGAGDTLPTDNPVRVWRKVTATLAITTVIEMSNQPLTSTQTVTLQEEISLTSQGWQVSRVLGV